MSCARSSCNGSSIDRPGPYPGPHRTAACPADRRSSRPAGAALMDGAAPEPLRRLRARLMHELRRAAAEEGVSDADLLALLAFETGALLACQDPRILMAEEGVDLVWRNIAAGNLAALTLIRSGPGRCN